MARSVRILGASLASALVLAVVADVVTGAVIRHRIADAAGKRVHGDVSVSLGGNPAVIDAVDHSIPSVTLTTADADFCAAHDLTVSATLTGLTKHGATVSVSSSAASIYLSTADLARTVRRRLPGATVRAEPATGTIHVLAGPNGVVDIAARPELRSGGLRLQLQSASFLDRAVPASALKRLGGKLSLTRTWGKLPLNLHPRNVVVDGDGVRVNFSGGSWRGSTSRPRHACSAHTAS